MSELYDDSSEDDTYIDLSKSQTDTDTDGDVDGDTDPEEYEDFVSFEYFEKAIQPKSSGAAAAGPTGNCRRTLQPEVETPAGPELPVADDWPDAPTFESEFESRMEGFLELGPRGTLKKSTACPAIHLDDIQGESKSSTSSGFFYAVSYVGPDL
jgi:hypothetical protein